VNLGRDLLRRRKRRGYAGPWLPAPLEAEAERVGLPAPRDNEPGALLEFLDKLGGRWNISLFHYRNHGADFGRVLAAFEVPPDEDAAFQSFLQTLGYPFTPEVGNPAYDLVLSGTAS
jgi:hypothetical protein